MGLLHVWQARLDAGGWPGAEGLPEDERRRAAAISHDEGRRHWVAARWALREVLAEYVDEDPAAIELGLGEHGKPALADPDATIRFNLSHSGELALVAVAERREVGVDVQLIGSRHPPEYYAEWARREAVAKCHGVGLWRELPDAPVTVRALDTEPGYAAALAVAQ